MTAARLKMDTVQWFRLGNSVRIFINLSWYDYTLYTICIVHTYLDLISLPLSYLNFLTFHFLCRCGLWVFIQQFRHMRTAGYKYNKFSYSRLQTCNTHYILSGSGGTLLSKYVLLFLASEQYLAVCLQCVSLL